MKYGQQCPCSSCSALAPWRFQTEEIQPSRGAGFSAVWGLASLVCFAVWSALPELPHAFQCCVTCCPLGSAARPTTKWGDGWDSTCWIFVLPCLCYRGFALSCHEQKSIEGTLWGHCDTGNQRILARALPSPYCVRKLSNFSVIQFSS